ncbi:hypothetical protein [Caulobacter sp. CCG-8]|uniref:hypothetical protein n=1 Tax=Caulobacter sp. CCG-8 TaxID=3127958 RepID=UPI00307E91D5
MSAARQLGPITEERFREVFSEGALACAKVAAKLVGLDADTLNEMTDQGIIRAVRRGRLRSWTEADLRAYLLEGPDAPERQRKPKPTSPPGHGRVVPFSKRAGAAKRRA